MMPSQQLSVIQQILQSLLPVRQQPPSAVIVITPAPTHATPGLFELRDDIRLRAIMERYPEPISQEQWREIASTFDPGATVQQIQVRWYNVVKPGIPFTISERRQILTLAIDHPCDWKWIARQVKNGDAKYSTVVRYCATTLLERLRILGFEVETSSDVALLPDAVIDRKGPKGAMRGALLAEYRARKARQAAEAEFAQTTGGADEPAPLHGESADETART